MKRHLPLAPPAFAAEETTRLARLLYEFVWPLMIVLAAFGCLLAAVLPENRNRWAGIIAAVLAVGMTTLVLNRRGYTRLSTATLIFGLWVIVSWSALTGGGTSAPAISGYLVLVLVSGLFWGGRAGFAMALFCSMTELLFAYLSVAGSLPTSSVHYNVFTSWLTHSMYLSIIVIFQFLAARSISDALQRAQTDLLNRQRAEGALRESETRYRTVVEHQTEFIVRWKRDGTRTFANEAYRRYFGLTLDRGVGASFLPLIHEEDRQAVEDKLARLISGVTACETDIHRVVKADGSIGWQEWTDQPIYDDAGQLVELQSVGRDITERVAAEQDRDRLHAQVERAAAEWQRTFDSVESSLLVLDHEGRVTRVNRLASTLLGRDHAAILGCRIQDMSSEEPWATAVRVVGALEGTNSGASGQARDAASGRAWDVAANLVTGGAATENRIALAARDITKIIALQESLRRSEMMAAMGSLVAGVAHEVRNPLFSISATLDALEGEVGMREEYAQLTTLMRSQVARLSQLMQDLLDYGKPVLPALARTDPGELLLHARHLCEPLAREVGVTFAEDVAPDLPPLDLDVARMHQVLENLIANAIQYSPRGGVVRLAARRVASPEGLVEFSVEDEGRGLAPADIPHLLEPFFSRRKGGTGLGLSIVQKIVEAHGGLVGAANRASGGAVFTVTLPLERARPNPESHSRAIKATNSDRKRMRR